MSDASEWPSWTKGLGGSAWYAMERFRVARPLWTDPELTNAANILGGSWLDFATGERKRRIHGPRGALNLAGRIVGTLRGPLGQAAWHLALNAGWTLCTRSKTRSKGSDRAGGVDSGGSWRILSSHWHV